MAIKRTRHAVYDANYHLVWTPKYRKWILRGDLREYVYQLFHRIAEQYDYEFEELTIAEDHVHMLVSFPPRDSIAKVVARFKSISASEIFRQFPEVKRELWKGAFWEVGYFARTVGSDVTAETIRKYIEYHGVTETTPEEQLELF